METLLVLMTILVPIIMGLDKILKNYIPKKFHPLIPLVLGLLIGPLGSTFASGLTLSQLLWAGLLAGMASGGSYNPTDLKKP